MKYGFKFVMNRFPFFLQAKSVQHRGMSFAVVSFVDMLVLIWNSRASLAFHATNLSHFTDRRHSILQSQLQKRSFNIECRFFL